MQQVISNYSQSVTSELLYKNYEIICDLKTILSIFVLLESKLEA